MYNSRTLSNMDNLPTPGTPQAERSIGFSTTTGEIVSALFEKQDQVESAFGLTRMWEDELQKRDDQIYELTGKRLGVAFPYPGLFDSPTAYKTMGPHNDAPEYRRRQSYESAIAIEKQIEELRKTYPQIKTRGAIMDEVAGAQKSIDKNASETFIRGGVFGKVVGTVVGGGAGSLTLNNPSNLASIPLGFAGMARTFAGRVGLDFLTQAGVESVNQLRYVKQNYEAMGREYTAEDAAGNIAMAGLGGAAFRGVAEGVSYGGGKVLQALQKRAADGDAFGKKVQDILDAPTDDEAAFKVRQLAPEELIEFTEITNPVMSTSMRGAMQAAEQQAMIVGANPFIKPEARAEHERILDRVREEAEAGAPLTDTSANQPIGVVMPSEKPVRISDLQVDARLMQFKTGGDDQGVTDALKNVKSWNPDFAGTITVWERADGTRFVADGHQRTALARRLMAENPEQDIYINAIVKREKDGYSAEQVRAEAALKNISQGTGTALDAAKVFRQMPADALSAFKSLPPNSALVRNARELAKLDDESFLMVVNGVVDDKIAAVVGRLEDDPNQQRSLLGLLAKEEPDTIFQAEQIVRQAQEAGFSKSEQNTLFGADTVTESLFKDKAKVLERALNLIKDDVRTFKNLLRNEGRISEAGNLLNQAQNANILTDAQTIMGTVRALAYRRGPIADALSEAAKKAKTNGRHKDAAKGFVDELRRQLDESGVAGLFGGDERALRDVVAEISKSTERESLSLALDTQKALTLDEPKTIERGYRDLRDAVIPAESKSSSVAAGESKSLPSDKSPSGTQAPLRQETMRVSSLDVFSSAAMTPDTLKGPLKKLGSMVPSKLSKDSKVMVYQTSNSVNKLVSTAESLKDKLAKHLENITQDIDGARVQSVRAKDPAEAELKAKELKREPSQISDYLGARIIADNVAAIDGVIAAIKQSSRVIEVDDFLKAGRSPRGGYRAVHIQAVTKDGFSYEVQVIPREVYAVYEEARTPYAQYKRYRNNIPADLAERADAEFAAADDLLNQAYERFTSRMDDEAVLADAAKLNPDEEVIVGVEFDQEGRELVQKAKLKDVLAAVDDQESLFKSMTECLV